MPLWLIIECGKLITPGLKHIFYEFAHSGHITTAIRRAIWRRLHGIVSFIVFIYSNLHNRMFRPLLSFPFLRCEVGSLEGMLLEFPSTFVNHAKCHFGVRLIHIKSEFTKSYQTTTVSKELT